MAGIDWQTANMDRREAFSFTSGQAGRLCSEIKKRDGVDGCVLLSTCNRTELYLSGEAQLQPAEILCQIAQTEDTEMQISVRREDDAARHLMQVACGLCSQILGEDQIVSQVKRAYSIAHEAQCTDAVLSQLFRLAATAGKRSRTQVRLSAAPLSAAGRAIALLEKLGDLRGKRVLVIGNGEMGRLASSLLVARGCDVTVTLRTYRHGQTVVPAGCKTIAYDARMDVIGTCDILLSATTSPHYTVTRADIEPLERIPSMICDLSVPRDIDPTIRDMDAVQVFLDMDSMGGQEESVNAADRARVEQIIEEEMAELARWAAYRDALPLMDELCWLAEQRVADGYDFAVLSDGEDAKIVEKMEHAARMAAEKTARLLLSGLQGTLSEDALAACREAMLRKAPQLRDRRMTE